MSSTRHTAKVLSTTVGNSIVAMATDIWYYLVYNSRGAWHTLYAMLLSTYNEMVPKIHKVKTCDFFFKPLAYSQFNSVINDIDACVQQIITEPYILLLYEFASNSFLLITLLLCWLIRSCTVYVLKL